MIRITTDFAGMPGTPYYSTLYFQGETQAAATAAAAQANAFWEGVDNVMSTGLTWNVQDDAEVVNPATGQVTGIFAVSGLSGAGEDPADEMPGNVQGLMRWRTGVYIGGREVRGRTFIPSPTEAANNGGFPSAAYITALTNAVTQMRLVETPGSEQVIWSPTKGVAHLVSAEIPWTNWATLRSRRD